MTDIDALIARSPDAQTVEIHPAATLEWCNEAEAALRELREDNARLIEQHLAWAAQASRAESALAAAQKDAERYNFIASGCEIVRNHINKVWLIMELPEEIEINSVGKTIDDAIAAKASKA